MAIMASRFQTLFFKLCKELKLKSKKDRVSTISYCVLYAKQYTNMSYACMIADHSQAAFLCICMAILKALVDSIVFIIL